MTETRSYAAASATAPLAPYRFDRREPGPDDVEIDILYCGICHSDVHFVRNDWGISQYPLVPGHEIVGRVRRTGAEATRFAEGELVGVGCLVDSCRACRGCRDGLEQYCEGVYTMTYGSLEAQTGQLTKGGFSERIVVDKDFVLKVPENLDPAGAAPLLCAGITTYSPLKLLGAGEGKTVGVVGLGGLGHMAIKLASAMGAQVVMFTTSPEKGEDARRLGAAEVVLSTDAAAMAAQANRFDIILDTVSAPHDLMPYLGALRRDGTLVMLGAPPVATPHPPIHPMPMLFGRKRMMGSLIGSLAETQQMLDFCGRHGITAEIELIRADEINDGFERMLAGEVRYRFVIDTATMRSEAAAAIAESAPAPA
ncbi:MAG: NAD(P)-dependent alcohol dehydrogenase [Sphingosinicella sp.]